MADCWVSFPGRQTQTHGVGIQPDVLSQSIGMTYLSPDLPSLPLSHWLYEKCWLIYRLIPAVQNRLEGQVLKGHILYIYVTYRVIVWCSGPLIKAAVVEDLGVRTCWIRKKRTVCLHCQWNLIKLQILEKNKKTLWNTNKMVTRTWHFFSSFTHVLSSRTCLGIDHSD